MARPVAQETINTVNALKFYIDQGFSVARMTKMLKSQNFRSPSGKFYTKKSVESLKWKLQNGYYDHVISSSNASSNSTETKFNSQSTISLLKELVKSNLNSNTKDYLIKDIINRI